MVEGEAHSVSLGGAVTGTWQDADFQACISFRTCTGMSCAFPEHPPRRFPSAKSGSRRTHSPDFVEGGGEGREEDRKER